MFSFTMFVFDNIGLREALIEIDNFYFQQYMVFSVENVLI